MAELVLLIRVSALCKEHDLLILAELIALFSDGHSKVVIPITSTGVILTVMFKAYVAVSGDFFRMCVSLHLKKVRY